MSSHPKTVDNCGIKIFLDSSFDSHKPSTPASPPISTILVKSSESDTKELIFKPKVEVAASLFNPGSLKSSSTLLILLGIVSDLLVGM